MEDEQLQQRKLFAELFGFKVGDRVKQEVLVFRGGGRTYWKYGTIKNIRKDASPDAKDHPYLVRWDHSYSVYSSAQKLVKVRPRGKETKNKRC